MPTHPDSGPEDPPAFSRIGLFEDVPGTIWTIFLGAWATFFLLAWYFFAVDRGSAFMVVIAMLFAVMAFGLPLVMARQSRTGHRPGRGVIQTRTGPMSTAAAAAQIALIPVAVVIGMLGFVLLAK